MKKAPPKKGAIQKVGVIATIASLIEGSGKKGVTKEEILEALVEKFPDRAKDSMKATIGIQVPGRMSREKFEIEEIAKGVYRKK